MKTAFHIFISAGETSGDRLGRVAIQSIDRALSALGRDVRWSGLGGAQMRHAVASGRGQLDDMTEVQAAGLVELLPSLPRLAKKGIALRKRLASHPPDLAILVDFPDFNLRLASACKKQSVPVLMLGAPQCWAWRPRRVRRLRAVIDRLAVLFPFEEEWFRSRDANARFIGHPLAQQLADEPEPEERRNGAEKAWRIALYPGSRSHEIEANLPLQLDALRLMQRAGEAIDPAIVAAPNMLDRVWRILEDRDSRIRLAKAEEPADLAWCAAGTASLELALRNRSFILTHRVHPVSFELARRLVRIDHVAMPNILAGRRVAPELLQKHFQPERLARESWRLLYDAERRRAMRREWRRLREELTARDPAVELARLALELLP